MKATILVADDSGLVRAVLTEQLTEHGCTVLQAADGEQAVQTCRRERPDMVLLDVDMPVRDGHQVLVELRAAPETRDIPVVFLTGRLHVADAAHALALGAHDYLRKPVDPVELIARIRAALRIAQLQEELRRRNDELSANVTELEAVNRRLTNVNQLAADLIAMLSHDLRQPLSTIIGYTEVLVTDWEAVTDEQKHKALLRTNAAAQHLDQLVEDVLVMAQADTEDLPTQRRPVFVTEVLVDALGTLAVDRDQVTVDAGTAAPAVLADPGHLRQIFANLVGNAFKYGAPPVDIDVRAADGTVEVRVSDHGDGVPPDFVPLIFERFARAATGTATTKKGTGLGLYIVRQLVQANGGSVRYEPHRPQGACFVLRLPAAPQPAGAGH